MFEAPQSIVSSFPSMTTVGYGLTFIGVWAGGLLFSRTFRFGDRSSGEKSNKSSSTSNASCLGDGMPNRLWSSILNAFGFVGEWFGGGWTNGTGGDLSVATGGGFREGATIAGTGGDLSVATGGGFREGATIAA
jgi:hypothetical protein